MASLPDIASSIRDISSKIAALESERDVLYYEYLKKSVNTEKAKIVEAIRVYMDAHGFTNYERFISLASTHLTMAPVGDLLSRNTKYGTVVTYDTVLYEWDNKKVMYVRANANCDNYFMDCDLFNRFAIDEMEYYPIQISYGFWKSDKDVVKRYKDDIERIIKTPHQKKRDFEEYTSAIPPEYKLIVILFDVMEGLHYCIREEVVPNAIHHLPISIYE
jgi:hypothetical protein